MSARNGILLQRAGAALALFVAALAACGCVSRRAIEPQVCGDIPPLLSVPSDAPLRDEINVLAISAGGPWGGFGIGFMDGWSQVKDTTGRERPPFDIAVGISTGAIVVTHAFLGADHDAAMRKELFALSTAGVFRRRSILTMLAADSVADTRPLRARLEKAITSELLDEVADAWLQQGRRLAVIALDMDCGRPELLDLTAVALARDRPDRVTRYIDYIMASSASPVAFPPVFIDGHMLVDGALRQHLPLPWQVEQLLAGRERPGQRVRLHIVVTSPLMAVPRCTTDQVLLIALRTGDVWTGERSRDTLELLMHGAAERGWSARYVMPEADPCAPVPPPDDYFNKAFMRCEFEQGRQRALGDASPWRERLPEVTPAGDPRYGHPHPCRTAR